MTIHIGSDSSRNEIKKSYRETPPSNVSLARSLSSFLHSLYQRLNSSSFVLPGLQKIQSIERRKMTPQQDLVSPVTSTQSLRH